MSSVKTPADLLSAVPFLVGYHPENSLVLISVKDDALAMAMRVDMPEGALIAGASELLASHLKRDEAESGLVVAYVNAENTNAESVLFEVADAVRALDIEVREVLLVRANRWRSLICSDLSCCPIDGNEMPDFGSARITAEQVAQGKVLPFNDSAELVASLESNELSTETEFVELVKSLHDKLVPPFGSGARQREGANALCEWKAQLEAGQTIPKELKALVIASLQDIQVRDYALGLFDDDAEMAKSGYCDLMKSAPVDFVAPLASLASAYAYENGEGALAHRLLDRAIEENPEYSLARLLRRVFSSGWPVEGFKQLRSELHPRVTASIFGSGE